MRSNYQNDFHKKQSEEKIEQINKWKSSPISFEEKKRQQEKLNQQRASREDSLE